MVYHSNINQKKNGSSCVDFGQSTLQSKENIRDKEGHYIIKGSILLEDVIITVHVPTKRGSDYVGQKLCGEIDESTALVGDFNTPLSEMEGSSRQKIRKDTVKLNTTINPLDVMDRLNTFYREYYLQNKHIVLKFI